MSFFSDMIQNIVYESKLLYRKMKNLSSQRQDSVVEGSLAPSVAHRTATTTHHPIWTPGQMTIFWIIGVLIAYGGYLAFQSLSLLYLILAAVLISVAIEFLVVFFQKWMPRGLAIAVSYILLLLFVVAGFVVILPFVLQQLSTIINIVISYLYTMGQQIRALGLDGYIQSVTWIPGFTKNYILSTLANDTMNIQASLMNNISTLVSTGSDYAKNIGGWALGFVGSFFSGLGKTGLVLTIAVLFSIEKDHVINFLIRSSAKTPSQITHISDKIDIFYNKMGLWLKAQFGLCLYIGIVVYVALLILSLFGIALPNIAALALMAGFTEFIPYIGPLLGAIPAVIVATSIYGLKGLIVVSITYFIIQWIENNILIPLLMNKSLGVSPLLIFLCVLIGGSVLGFIGVLLAVPFSIIITMFVKKDFQ